MHSVIAEELFTTMCTCFFTFLPQFFTCIITAMARNQLKQLRLKQFT